MTGLTLKELCAALADELALYAPAPPPDRLRLLIEAADDYAPDPDLEPEPRELDADLEPALGWTRTMAHGDCSGLDLEAEHCGREPEHHC